MFYVALGLEIEQFTKKQVLALRDHQPEQIEEFLIDNARMLYWCKHLQNLLTKSSVFSWIIPNLYQVADELGENAYFTDLRVSEYSVLEEQLPVVYILNIVMLQVSRAFGLHKASLAR